MVVWVAVGVFGAMGCAAATQTGDPERGKQLYDTPIKAERGELQPCSKCHPVGAGQKPATGIGMNLGDIGSRAGSIVPNQSAEEYLRTSIVDPDAHLAGGFQDGLMSREYQKLLSAQQIEDLVAYMVMLKVIESPSMQIKIRYEFNNLRCGFTISSYAVYCRCQPETIDLKSVVNC